MKKFWMVIGDGPTHYRHDTEQQARTEAERLARANPGKPFVVLEAMDVVVKNDVHWQPLREEGDVPF